MTTYTFDLFKYFDRFVQVWHFSKWYHISLKLKALLLDVVEPIYWKYKIPFNWNLAMFGTGHTNFWTKITRRRIIDLRPFVPYKKNIKLNNKSISNNKIKIGFGGTLVGTASKKSLGTKPGIKKWLPPTCVTPNTPAQSAI